MGDFIRESVRVAGRQEEIIYIGGNKSDLDKFKHNAVNISHLGFGMTEHEHKYVIAYCFGITFYIFKGSNEFEAIYHKFIEWQEKLYNCQKSNLRENYNTIRDMAKANMENIITSIAIKHVNSEDICNYISEQKAKSYKEGYEEHKKQLRIIFGLERGEI